MKIYVAASFAYEDTAKTSQRKDLIEKTVKRIKKLLKGDYYLPQQLKIPNAWGISLEEWSKAVYEEDMKQLNSADLVLFLSFGKENNAGSVWEVGYICGQNKVTANPKKLVVVKMTTEAESLMTSNACDTIINEKDIEEYDWLNLPKHKINLDKLA